MNKTSIGVDIVKIDRLKDKLKKKILSLSEQQVYNQIKTKDRKKEFLAAHFAAKEALFKASNKYINYDKITISNKESGLPYFEDIDNAKLSIAHEKKYAIAFVIIEEIGE